MIDQSANCNYERERGSPVPRMNGEFKQSQVENTSIDNGLITLYSRPVPSTRTGPIFNAHSYPTKISPTAIAPFILAHTGPGDLVFDGFAGSGSTGLAVALCDNPEQQLRESVETVVDSVNWGPRRCVLYDLSELACFISKTLLDPPHPNQFEMAAKEVLSILDADYGWMYRASGGTSSSTGVIRYVFWSDYAKCPYCGAWASFWELAVTSSPPQIASDVLCTRCKRQFNVSSAARRTEDYWDDLLGENRTRRVRRPVFVYGRSGRSFWKRAFNDADFETFERINSIPVPPSVPIVPMLGSSRIRWGELYRAGYHFGITHLHHFYTRRNLIAVASAWQAAEVYQDVIRDALRFWISSYNASHATLMTRVVCKQNAKDFVVTSAQPGALYISSLPVEKNVFAGMQTKMKTISAAFSKMQGRNAKISVRCASSLTVDLPDSSVDYAFTDPPFGYNIQYSEVNFISESWLGNTTDAREEAIISPHRGKLLPEYEPLLRGALAELFRILKPEHYVTIVFHSTSPEVWDALRKAWETAGFEMVLSSILDKTQTSFKQTTTKGAVSGDPAILLRKPAAVELRAQDHSSEPIEEKVRDPWGLISARLSELDENGSLGERTKQRLYSYLITYYLIRGQSVPLSARKFFVELDQQFELFEGKYYRTNKQ